MTQRMVVSLVQRSKELTWRGENVSTLSNVNLQYSLLALGILGSGLDKESCVRVLSIAQTLHQSK